MTQSKNYIEDLHTRLKAVADREQQLIHALNEALTCADRKLLDDVRSVTMEHEARRAVILTELQTLAGRIGAFPAGSEPCPMIEDETLDLPYYATDDHASAEAMSPVEDAEEVESYSNGHRQNGHAIVSGGGDWRKAAEKIRDGFDFQMQRRAS